MNDHACVTRATVCAFFEVAWNLELVSYSYTPKSMADGQSENHPWTNLSPRIIFVRLSKDKSKDTVEDEIFKYIKKVLDESTDGDSELEKAKNCVTLPDFGTSKIVQVAVGPAFIGFLFHDGRVCRVKCVSKSAEGTQTLINSQGSSEEPIFQVKSDEVYAKQLQNQLNEEIRINRTSPSRSLVHGGATSSPQFSFRASDRYGLGNAFLSNRTRQRVARPWTARTSSSNYVTTQVKQETQTKSEEPQQSSNTRSSPVGDGESSSHETNADESKQSSNSDKNINPDESFTDGGNSVTSVTCNTKLEDKETAGTSNPNVQDKCNQEVENSSGNLSANHSSLETSSRSSSSRRLVSSPTLLHRTVYTTNLPGVVRPWPPYGIPVVGSVQQFPPYISRGNQMSGRSSVPLQAHVVRAHLAEQLAGAYVFSRGPTSTNFQRTEERAAGDNSKTISCNDPDFCYPEIGNLEWLEVENVSEAACTCISLRGFWCFTIVPVMTKCLKNCWF